MAFCTKCGKEVADGEVCSCQATKAAPVNVDVAGEAGNIIGNAMDIVGDPEGGVARFLAGISWAKVVVLTAIYAILDIVYGIWNMVKSNIENKKRWEDYADDLDMDLDEYIDEFELDEYLNSFGDIMKGVFMDILYVAATVAVTALVFWLAFKFIKKVQITWQKAFGIAVIELLIVIPLLLAYRILDFVPDFKLWSWILSAIWAVKSWGSVVLTYLAVRSECEDTKSAVYVAAPSIAVISLLTAFANFIISSLLN